MANRGQIPTNNSALIAMIADEGWALIIWVQELGFEFLSYFSYTMSGVKQSTLRKAIGALKDKTTVSLAKVHSDYKELDINLVKATNHVERPAKEQHIKTVFAYISGIRPRADIAYCIHALSRRLAKTHNWAVALKTLILIHRALREVDQTFHEELINYSRCKRHMLNMANFKDDSSPNAWDYSVWVRNYALFLEERLECMRVLKYDVEMDYPFCISVCTMVLLGAAWNGSCTDSPKQGRFLEQNQPRRWQNSLQEVQTP